MNQEKLADLIRRYKAGTATPEDNELLDKIWSEAQLTSLTDHTDEELETIEHVMLSTIQGEIHKQAGTSHKFIRHRPMLYKVAATLLLLVVASFAWYRYSNQLNEVRTDFGEQRTIILPDQSEVVLNGNSVIKYASNWSENTSREVWIEGEGFFSVVHTKNHQKFVVHGVSQLNVEVLGTKFNIKTRQSTSEVMLAEGKVKIELGGVDSTQRLYLEPGELARVHDQKVSTQTVPRKQYTSWVENKLYFDRTSLRELAILLKDTYGLTVAFADPELESRELSGEISSANEDEILFAVGETLGINVEKEGRTVTISLKHN